METTPRTVEIEIEIELEELDGGSWRAALANLPAGASGTGRFRFVARLPGDSTTGLVGSPFLMPRASVAGLADDGEADVDARVRLGELDNALTIAGWSHVPERGEHWWSLRYTKD